MSATPGARASTRPLTALTSATALLLLAHEIASAGWTAPPHEDSSTAAVKLAPTSRVWVEGVKRAPSSAVQADVALEQPLARLTLYSLAHDTTRDIAHAAMIAAKSAHPARRNTSAALIPPNPNEFDKITSGQLARPTRLM
jgi:hypothetical protein